MEIEKKAAFKSRTPYKNQDPTHRAQRSISFSESISPAPPKDNRPRGKHSRLRRELSLAISNSSAVCSIVHQEPEHTNNSDSDLPDLTCTSEDSDDEEDEDDDSFFGCPSNMRYQSLEAIISSWVPSGEKVFHQKSKVPSTMLLWERRYVLWSQEI